jgi:heme-degrading monooxygenase HmoA
MPKIESGNSVVTHITAINVDPEKQSDLLQLMENRARFMAKQPGFVSISLHRGISGMHVVNYVQWANREQFEAACKAQEFRALSARFNVLIQDVESDFFEIVLVDGA